MTLNNSMKRYCIIGIILLVLVGCQNINPSEKGRKEYQYYDESVNLIKITDEEDSEAKNVCSSFSIIQYDQNDRVVEINNYLNLNDYDPKNDMHVYLVNSYEGEMLVSSKIYTYLYDDSLYQLYRNEYKDNRIIKVTEYSVDGREKPVSNELYEYNEFGDLIKSLSYDGEGILISSQEWRTDETGKTTYISTAYNSDGSIKYQEIIVKEE